MGELVQCLRLQDAIVELIRDERKTFPLREAEKLLASFDASEDTTEHFRLVVEALTSGEDVANQDIHNLIGTLYDYRNRLEFSIDHQLGPALTTEDPEVRRLEESIIEAIQGRSRRDIQSQVKGLVYDRPGLYVKELHDELRTDEGFEWSYSTVLKYVNELERDGSIITVGGPQGRYRYCYPNPKYLEDWSPFYYGKFAIQGEIEAKLTSNFRQWVEPFRDIFLLNSDVRQTLVSVRINSKELQPGLHVECLGRLNPPAELRDLGLKPIEADVPSSHLVEAARIESVETNRVALYQDQELLKEIS